jgi:serine phosphatase RsbU (regulator of sigma subunit)
LPLSLISKIRIPFKYKFILSFSILEFVFLILIVTLNYNSIQTNSKELLEDKVTISSQLFSDLIKSSVMMADTSALDDMIKTFIKTDDICSIIIKDAENKEISSFVKNINITKDNENFITIIKDIKIYGQKIGEVKIIYDVSKSQENINSITNQILILAFIEIILSIIISYLLGQKTSSAIERLQKGVQNIYENGECQKINIDIKTGDELEFLANSFIQMQEKVISSTNELKNLNKDLESKVKKRTEQLSVLNEHLSTSIRFASSIQRAILPNENILNEFFLEHFIYYQPKDIVSGDIYLFNKISEDEILIFTIDCTGHGVGGAFITMLVKAIQQDILKENDKSHILFDENHDFINTGKLLSIFNHKLKKILNKHDVGFDGSILYVNKKTKLATYSSANSQIFLLDKNKEIKYIKADKCSIGYKKSELNYEFSNYFIDLTNIDKIYLSTDGFIDQLGGKKGFPFAKKKFKKIIKDNTDTKLSNQKEIFIEEIKKYQREYENTDDRTIIALQI